ncbi:MAG TPA: RNA methyltransferase [Acidimicrobiales bacterium]|nr:RNA methyltransferase [Acidimicrobiales bacterium]
MPETVGSFLAVYGRIPVLEALADEQLEVEQVLVSRRARGEHVDDIVRAATARGVPVRVVSPEKVTRMSGNGRQDQGVVADVRSAGVRPLEAAAFPATGPVAVLVLDGVTNPANVGMIVRTAVAAGCDGVVLPRAGGPDVGPLVVKASAGVALRAPIFSNETALGAVSLLKNAGFRVVGLVAGSGVPLWSWEPPERVALVLGSESEGLSPAVVEALDGTVAIPLAGGVESLNVAVAAGVVCFALRRGRA